MPRPEIKQRPAAAEMTLETIGAQPIEALISKAKMARHLRLARFLSSADGTDQESLRKNAMRSIRTIRRLILDSFARDGQH